jgi:hypothetical protein
VLLPTETAVQQPPSAGSGPSGPLNNYYLDKMSTYSVPVRVLWDKPLAVKKKPIELNPRLPNDPCGRLWLEVAV